MPDFSPSCRAEPGVTSATIISPMSRYTSVRPSASRNSRTTAGTALRALVSGGAPRLSMMSPERMETVTASPVRSSESASERGSIGGPTSVASPTLSSGAPSASSRPSDSAGRMFSSVP